MSGRVWSLLRWIMMLYGTAFILFIGATVTLETRQLTISVILAAVATLFFIPGFILSKIQDRETKETCSKLSQMMRNMDIVPAVEEDYPWLDHEKLLKWTADLEVLGFERLQDCTVGTGGISLKGFQLPRSFTRVMVNKEHRCFGEIGQNNKAESGPEDMHCTLSTLFESDRRCQTTNKPAFQPSGIRQSQAVDIVKQLQPNVLHEPNADPADLFRFHLEQRDRLAVDQRLTILEDTSYETYRRQSMNAVNSLYKKVNESFDQIPE